MLNTSKLRNIYSKIQTQLFYMIPEKWDKIYLYASIIDKTNNIQTGEMFFYYFPKGILKKNPVNVYEIPSKFNIDEKAYIKLVDKLYETIKLLRKEFENSKEKLWSNLTISIENLKFHVEYNYENLLNSSYNSYDRHIVWKYKNLAFPIERLSKRDQEMLEKYLIEEKFENIDTKNYTEGMYQNKVHNIIEYDRQEKDIEELQENQKQRKTINSNSRLIDKISKEEEKRLDKYELYKRQIEQQKKGIDRRKIQNKEISNKQILNKEEKTIIGEIQQQNKTKKNQILNF